MSQRKKWGTVEIKGGDPCNKINFKTKINRNKKQKQYRQVKQWDSNILFTLQNVFQLQGKGNDNGHKTSSYQLKGKNTMLEL